MVICEECKGTKRALSGGRWVKCGACERRELGIEDPPVLAEAAPAVADPSVTALTARLAASDEALGSIGAILNTWGREAYGMAEENPALLGKFAESLWALTIRALESAKARVDSSDQALAIVTAELESIKAAPAPQIAVPETPAVVVEPEVIKEAAHSGKKR